MKSRVIIKKNSKGFTLTELLVVMVIVIILTAAILVDYRNSGQQFALQRSAHKLAQDIRRAGQMAMSAQECCGGIVPPGYGIWLEQGTSSSTLYADTSPSGNPDEFYKSPPSNDDIIEIINLEKDVIVQKIDTPDPDGEVDSISINFKPPSPTIMIKYRENKKVNEVTVTLTSGGNTKTIRVNAVGLVEVE